ncbi:MAG: EamA family transporter [Candidatus Melainabacteria bacterium]|nr:EamA family transporter [Candidatus Melainabacteria bacterium]
MNWIVLGLLSAFFASLVSIFGKIGMKSVDSITATTIRVIVMSVILLLVFATQAWQSKTNGLSAFNIDTWKFVLFSGLAGAASWLCYFQALKLADASKVASLDRLSLHMTFILAIIFLGEKLTWKLALGGALLLAGTLIVCL